MKLVIALAVALLLVSQVAMSMDMSGIEKARSNLNSVVDRAQSSFSGSSGSSSFGSSSIGTASDNLDLISTQAQTIDPKTLDISSLIERIESSLMEIYSSIGSGTGIGSSGVGGVPPVTSRYYHQELVDMLKK